MKARHLSISIEQARAIEAAARLGSFSQAAKESNKAHTGILYLVTQFEKTHNILVFDRSHYRATLTKAGSGILRYCQQMLAVENELAQFLEHQRYGYPQRLSIIADGLFNADLLLRMLSVLGKSFPHLQTTLRTEYLRGVNEAFEKEQADAMITLSLPSDEHINRSKLAAVDSFLVASPKVLSKRGTYTSQELADISFLCVKDAEDYLNLPTRTVEKKSILMLNDFTVKKSALIARLGYGWMPGHLIQSELKKQVLKKVNWQGANHKVFTPYFCWRKQAVQQPLLEAIQAALTAPCQAGRC